MTLSLAADTTVRIAYVVWGALAGILYIIFF